MHLSRLSPNFVYYPLGMYSSRSRSWALTSFAHAHNERERYNAHAHGERERLPLTLIWALMSVSVSPLIRDSTGNLFRSI
jgi:hypothetical protein